MTKPHDEAEFWSAFAVVAILLLAALIWPLAAKALLATGIVIAAAIALWTIILACLLRLIEGARG